MNKWTSHIDLVASLSYQNMPSQGHFFFFYRQLLSVMNKNVLRILPRSVVGGLKKKELSRAAASTPFAFPSWFLSDSTSGCESVEGACWHCCSPAGTHRASSPLPCQWASVCTFRPVTASYTTPIVTIPQFRKQPEVASLPHSLSVSSPPPLRVSQRCYSKFISVVPTKGQWICGLLSI